MVLFLVNRAIRAVAECGLFRKRKLPRPTVSFGNLSFGGTGKTPHVIFLAQRLVEKGLKVAVLTRGYRRKGKGLVVCASGDNDCSPELVGDEPYLIKTRVPEVTLGVCSDRESAAKEILERVEVDVFILDDGFQQFFLEKDVDVVLVPQPDLPFLGTLRRRMSLREDVVSISRADYVIITKWQERSGLSEVGDRLKSLGYEREWGISTYVPRSIVDNRGGERPLEGGDPVFIFGGIAGFGSFRALVERTGMKVAGEKVFPDHVEYDEKSLEEIRKTAGNLRLLTTEKDLVKLPYERFGLVEAIRVEVEFLKGEDFFLDMVDEILSGGGV